MKTPKTIHCYAEGARILNKFGIRMMVHCCSVNRNIQKGRFSQDRYKIYIEHVLQSIL